MRTLMIAIVAAAGLVVASCAPSPSPPVAGVPVSQVQQITKRVCGFLPTAQTVAGIFATFVSGGSAVVGVTGKVAAAICDAIINNPMTEGPLGGRTIPRVNGVAVEGTFVRR